MAAIELRLPPDVSYVGMARLVVTLAARQCGMDAARVEDLRLAVSEATTNAVLSHQRGSFDDPVVLRFGVEEGSFEVVVEDAGPGFEPQSVDIDRRDWRSENGLGLVLIRGLADQVEFVREAGMKVSMRFAVALDHPA